MSQEELGQAGPSWMKNSTMMNDELLNDDEKFYNDENELLNDEGKFYNQKSRNMMVPKNEFRHHKKCSKIKIMCNLCYFRTNDMMQWIKISLSFVFMFHFQRLNHRQVVMRCICRFNRRGSSSLFCVRRLNIFL